MVPDDLAFSDMPEDPEDDAVYQRPGGDALHSAVKSLIHTVQTEDIEAPKIVVY